MQELAGKVALVTGAGRGIGRATALALAHMGVAVALTARSEQELSEVEAEIKGLGLPVMALPLNLADPASAALLISSVTARLGRVDILVNNAGVAGPFGPSWEVDPEQWEATLTVNLIAPFRLARLVLPAMLQQGWGRIINVSSGAARNPIERGGSYSTSKAGLDMFTRQLGVELMDTGIAAISVYPGIVDTPMQTTIRTQSPDRVGEAVAKRFKEYYLNGQLLAPEKPANLIAALASAAGAAYHGQIIDIYSPEAQALLEGKP